MRQDQLDEVLRILQEECAEVTQAVSKVFRFGSNRCHPDMNSPTNKERLEEEIGDLLAMVDILVEQCYLSDSNVNEARKYKKEKLKKWTNIYDVQEQHLS
jgi:NTP pyrophosphatase (non-canonical NTP hydrolase)